VVDLILLRARWRRLPTGRRAWLTALVAPLVTGIAWWGLAWIRGVTIHVGIVMAAAAVLLRLGFGLRP
jgi:hypothetical protein